MTRRRSLYISMFVFFIQVWNGPDVHAITSELKSKFQYSFSAIHDANGEVPHDGYDTLPPCPQAMFGPLLGCLQANGCSSETTIEGIFGCIESNCLTEYRALPQECWACSFNSGPSFTNIIQRLKLGIHMHEYACAYTENISIQR